MGDLGARPLLSFNRALWTAPLDGEEGVSRPRIIHARALQLHGMARLHRLGVRRAPGYHKCGSQQDLDWVNAFRMQVWDGEMWHAHRHERNLPQADPGTVQWFDLDGIATSAVILEVRRSGIDAWWTPWNLTEKAFVLEGEWRSDLAPRNESNLELDGVALSNLPDGLTAEQRNGAVRFRSRHLDVGFYLNRAGFAHLCIDASGRGNLNTNLLHRQPGTFHQGVQLHPVGAPPAAAPALRYDVEGSTRVNGNCVAYDIRLVGTGQHYRLVWTVHPDRLQFHAERTGDRPIRAWHSSAWCTGLRSTVSPAHVLGVIQRRGETGWVELPAWLHAPRFGSLRIDSADDRAALRTNVYRPMDLITAEVKLGETPQPEGDYLLPAGRYTADIEWVVDTPDIPMQSSAPEAIDQAVQRCSLTALTYRPDTATLSNNGASMHCPICMDNWAATATRLGEILPGLDAVEILRTSLERWLNGGPGYASGRLLKNGEMHDAEDEYLMTGTAGLLGLALYLQHSGTAEWVRRFRTPIQRKLATMRQRDLDDDGLIESPHRTGVSGTGQWSTCWFDVISFGWKDAFANALLYPALTTFAEVLPSLDAADLADGLADWAAQLHDSYLSTFFNPETGWLAGWRCKEDRLHDHAFLPINGAAVCGGLLDEEAARAIMERLWQETQRVDLPDPALGLPGNLWPIPDEDLADIMQGYPLGYYQNGGRTHSQARHFVGALYQVGMTNEADHMLERLCTGLAEGRTYGGSKSGVDWRYWDDRPSGYEGLLTDQFGVLAVALERYGAAAS